MEVYVTELLPYLWPSFLVGFVSAVLYAILRGHLVPKRSVDAQVASLQQVVVLWKEAAEGKDQVAAEMLPLIRQGLENDQLTIGLISGLKEAVNRLEPSTPNRRDGDRE